MSLDIEISREEKGRCKIGLKGRLDTHTSPQLETALAGLATEEFPLQILDMEKLDYISSAGLRCLFRARKMVVAGNGRLLLVNLLPQVKKVLDIIKALPAEDVFDNHADMEEYLRTIDKPSIAGH